MVRDMVVPYFSSCFETLCICITGGNDCETSEVLLSGV